MSSPFPIDAVMPDIIAALQKDRCLIVRAEPGAGKTTRVPPALLRSGLLGQGQLVMLEPRRVAARSAAAFMAAGLDEPVGHTAGYRIRYEQRESQATRILVMTEGILTRRFVADPFLEGVSVVVLDEFHERSVHLDLCLAFIRELQQVREDLKLVIMSATLDVASLSQWLGGCPVVAAPGRVYPLEISHDIGNDGRPLPVRAAAAVQSLMQEGEGDVLVFLPGASAIHRTLDVLHRMRLPGDPDLLPLYSALPPAEQDRALCPSPRRRVIAATNIAETSLTIPGVTAVVDSGLQRRVRFDPAVGLDRMEVVPISQWSAAQRAGRAGRTAPGRVHRLWTRASERGRPPSDLPEMRRVDPLSAILQILHFHPGDPALFQMLDPIPAALSAAGTATLRAMGAVASDQFALTEKGRELAAFPMHPRLGAIVLAAEHAGCPGLGVSVAALLEEADILNGGETVPFVADCDLTRRLELLEIFEKEGATPDAAFRLDIRFSNARRVLQTRDQWQRQLGVNRAEHETGISIGRLLLAGYADRVCAMRAAQELHGVMVGGTGVVIDRRSGVRQSKLFVAVEAEAASRASRSRSLVRMASTVSESDLAAVFPSSLTERVVAVFDRDRQAVIGRVERLFRDLVISSKTGAVVDDEPALIALLENARDAFARFYKPDAAARAFMARIRYAGSVMPELEWPGVDEDAMKKRLAHLAVGMRSFGELEKIDWEGAVRNELTPSQRAALHSEFPETIATPAGSRIRIDYEEGLKPGLTPVVAIRLQEMFGVSETPRIGRGRISLTLSLLAPNMRPLQITRDLAGFWKNTYPQVRAELRARYARHEWPQDPLAATPTNRARRRG